MGYRHYDSGYPEEVQAFVLCFLLFIAGFFTFGIAWIGLLMVALNAAANSDTHSTLYYKNRKTGNESGSYPRKR